MQQELILKQLTSAARAALDESTVERFLLFSQEMALLSLLSSLGQKSASLFKATTIIAAAADDRSIMPRWCHCRHEALKTDEQTDRQQQQKCGTRLIERRHNLNKKKKVNDSISRLDSCSRNPAPLADSLLCPLWEKNLTAFSYIPFDDAW